MLLGMQPLVGESFSLFFLWAVYACGVRKLGLRIPCLVQFIGRFQDNSSRGSMRLELGSFAVPDVGKGRGFAVLEWEPLPLERLVTCPACPRGGVS